MSAAPAFVLPPALEAAEPPEARGPARDAVRLLVARGGGHELLDDRFHALPAHLRRGDLLVVNTSATLPASLPATLPDGTQVDLHLSTPEPPRGTSGAAWRDGGAAASPGGAAATPGGDAAAAPDDVAGRWIVELRRGGERVRGARPGLVLALAGGGRAELLAGFLSPGRLWVAALDLPAPLLDHLARHGRPIRYRHLARPRPLADHQTIFANEPGSAEMPSAARPFTHRLLRALADRGVGVAPLVLHTGVSSQEAGERPYPERFRVPETTAARVNAARRVIAVGTTVVRALETAADDHGRVAAAAGWTSLVVTPERGVRVVDGMLTGWHDPAASHLQLLEAVGGRDLVARSYAAALARGYRRHEFGDAHLILR